MWSNCNVQYANSLQILQNRLAKVLLSADIGTRIIDLMNTLKWSKLDQRWKLCLLLRTFKCLKGARLFIYRLNFPLQLILIIQVVKLQYFVSSLKNNSRKGTFYYRASKLWNNLTNDIRCNYKSMSMQKKFWLLYNELYCISYVYCESHTLISLHF